MQSTRSADHTRVEQTYDKEKTYGLTGETLNEDLGVLVCYRTLISRRTQDEKNIRLVGRNRKTTKFPNAMLLTSMRQYLLMRMFLIVSS